MAWFSRDKKPREIKVTTYGAYWGVPDITETFKYDEDGGRIIHDKNGITVSVSRNQSSEIPESNNSNVRKVVLDNLSSLKLLIREAERTGDYTDQQLTTFGMVRHLWPRVDSRSCPYCGMVFEKPVKRARKCPECSQHVNVRASLILTDAMVRELDTWRDRNTRIAIAKNCVQSAEYSLASELYIFAARDISVGFCKLGAFDKSWQILTNSDVLSFASLLDTMDGWDMTLDIFHARSRHSEDEMNYTEDERIRAKKAVQLVWTNSQLLVQAIISGKTADDYRVENSARQINRLSEIYKIKTEAIIDRAVSRPDAPARAKSIIMSTLRDKRDSFISPA